MGKQFTLGDKTLLALRDAAREVGYTHDYVARLAREGKVAAVQVNRQWFIDVESLQNFYTDAQLELQARNEYVSELRRVEREVSEIVRETTDQYKTGSAGFGKTSAVRSFVVIVLGCLVGLLMHVSYPTVLGTQTASVVEGLGVGAASVPDWAVGEIVVTDSPLSLDAGIVLLPKDTGSSSEVIVENLFADPVTIYELSSTTGSIMLTGASSTELQYVRIPDTATVRGMNVSSSTGP